MYATRKTKKNTEGMNVHSLEMAQDFTAME